VARAIRRVVPVGEKQMMRTVGLFIAVLLCGWLCRRGRY